MTLCIRCHAGARTKTLAGWSSSSVSAGHSRCRSSSERGLRVDAPRRRHATCSRRRMPSTPPRRRRLLRIRRTTVPCREATDHARPAQQCARRTREPVRGTCYYPNSTVRRRIRWARPDQPVKLGADEYFVLGDNSVISGDARYWSDRSSSPTKTSTSPPAACPAGSCSARRSSSTGPPAIARRPALPGVDPEFRGHAVHSLSRRTHVDLEATIPPLPC